MKMGTFAVNFGAAEITFSSIDTEKATGAVEITGKVLGLKVNFHISKGKNWSEERNWNIRVTVVEEKPVEPTPPEDQDDEDMEWLEGEDEEPDA